MTSLIALSTNRGADATPFAWIVFRRMEIAEQNRRILPTGDRPLSAGIQRLDDHMA